MALEDSEQLLDELWRHATRLELTWYQQWRVGDLVMWDIAARCIAATSSIRRAAG